MPMIVEKIRLRFRKCGAMRLVSHHDLMRCFERMLRRSGLPFASTAGFHPKPRLVFALSLPLGIIGSDEVVELALDQAIEPDIVKEKLAAQAPPGLEFQSAMRIATKTTAHVQCAGYRLAMGPHREEATRAKAQQILAAGEVWVERTRPEPKKLDIAPYLRSIQVHSDFLELFIRVTPNGSARPDEVLRALGLGDLLDEGAVIERFLLELQDDVPSTENTAPIPALAGGGAT